jgi:hypothetical protein
MADTHYVGVLYAIALAINNFMHAAPGFPGFLVYIALASIPMTLLHELGHAMAARQRLQTPVGISVGSAVKIAEIRLGEVKASIHAFERPDRLAGVATFDATGATAADIAWIAIAGPIASLVGLLCAIPLYNAVPDTGLVHGILWATVATSTFAVIVNLIPFEVQERRGQVPKRTDGKLVLSALKVARRAG